MILLAEGMIQSAGVPRDPIAALDIAWVAALMGLPWLYLLFLSGLDTPLVKHLRTRPARLVLFGLLGAGALAVGLAAPSVLRGEDPTWFEPIFALHVVAFILVIVFALVASASAYRRTETKTLARARASAYLAAFGTRDVMLGASLLILLATPGDSPSPWSMALAATSTIAFGVLLTYGIFRLQLFDLDARVRWTVSRGALLLAFVVAFVAASQTAAALLEPRFGILAGILAALALLPALLPLRRAADRIAGLVMPEKTTKSSRAQRLEIYRAALTEFDGRGVPSVEDETYLARLREDLELDERDLAVLARSIGTPRGPGSWAVGARVLERFRILRELGEGGEGRVYLAEDEALQRHVAIKVLRESQARDAVHEARALAAVRHPAVASIHDVQRSDEGAFIIMEHVLGGSLRARLERGRLDPREWRVVAEDVLDGLSAIHAAGLVHGDLKPANVLLTESGRAKLADFGIARGDDERTRTNVGGTSVHGTPCYMSPEQARGARASMASDLYAAALTLLEALRGDADAPSEATPLGSWFRRALDVSPSRRFSSAREMKDALELALRAQES